jgi:cyclase
LIVVRPRLIPCLLIQNGGLVKTAKFADPKYVGDPLNAVRIFNEKGVDELVAVDIDATPQQREPDYRLIGNLANECRMPLCYGGGVTNCSQIEKIIGLGVEKVAIGAAAVARPELVSEGASRIGRQSIVVVVDVKKTGLMRRHEVVTHNGTVRSGHDPIEFARRMQEHGAGEILLNSVDRDGTMEGYDLKLAARLRDSVTIPMTVLGGAGSLQDVENLYKACGIVGAGAGSLFVFKGKYRAVLINYPNGSEKDALLARAGFRA